LWSVTPPFKKVKTGQGLQESHPEGQTDRRTMPYYLQYIIYIFAEDGNVFVYLSA